MRSAFRDFPTYVAAFELARDVHACARRWPSFDRGTIGYQLVRAAHSVGANIAEASGRWQPADKHRLLTIARGSMYETEHWLTAATEQGLLEDLTERLDPIAQGLSHLMAAQRKR